MRMDLSSSIDSVEKDKLERRRLAAVRSPRICLFVPNRRIVLVRVHLAHWLRRWLDWSCSAMLSAVVSRHLDEHFRLIYPSVFDLLRVTSSHPPWPTRLNVNGQRCIALKSVEGRESRWSTNTIEWTYLQEERPDAFDCPFYLSNFTQWKCWAVQCRKTKQQNKANRFFQCRRCFERSFFDDGRGDGERDRWRLLDFFSSLGALWECFFLCFRFDELFSSSDSEPDRASPDEVFRLRSFFTLAKTMQWILSTIIPFVSLLVRFQDALNLFQAVFFHEIHEKVVQFFLGHCVLLKCHFR